MASAIGFLSMVLLVCSVPVPVASYTMCAYVFEYFQYCIDFLVGDQAPVSKRCCQHIEKLNFIANHMLSPRLICQCIEAMVKGQTPPLIAYNIVALTHQCKTHLSFPISSSMNCSQVPN